MQIQVDSRLGGNPVYYLSPQEASDFVRVPETILDCVVFVGVREESGIRYAGTGWLVGVTTLAATYVHLVTAKHIAAQIAEEKLVVRVNRKSGDPIEIGTKGTKWWYHPTDSNVDVAITTFGVPQEVWDEIDVKSFPVESFATETIIKDRNIGIGDQVFVTGLFTQVQKTSRNIPILRSGNVAMMPKEKIPFGDAGLLDAYLIEGRSIGGLSGSPVFVRETLNVKMQTQKVPQRTTLMFGVGDFFLFGSMIGHWDIPVETHVRNEAVNMGISIVVPAYKIIDIINQPELAEMRKKWDKEKLAKSGEGVAVLDSALSDDKKPFTQQDFEQALKKVSRRARTFESDEETK